MDEFDALFGKERDRLSGQFAKKHEGMLETSRVFHEAVNYYRKQGWDSHAEVWNIALYLNIAAHDISVLIFQLAAEREPWTRKLAARHVALAAYETVEDMTQLLGKPIREPLKKLGLLNSLDQQLRQARQPLDSYWQTYGPTLKTIRLTAVAHREHDGLALFETIDGIDIKHMMELGLRLNDVQNQLGPQLLFILQRTATTRPPELGSS